MTGENPAEHWLTRHEYGWDEQDRPTVAPRLIADEVAAARAQLSEDYEGRDRTPVAISELRVMIVATVLEECAARLRLAATSGDPAGSDLIAGLAGDLANYLYSRTSFGG